MSTARQALVEMRRLLGLLRDAQTATTAAPLPGMESRLDVALMDIRMPRMDGIEATRRLLSEPRDRRTRVLMLTTFDLDEYVYEALRAG